MKMTSLCPGGVAAHHVGCWGMRATAAAVDGGPSEGRRDLGGSAGERADDAGDEGVQEARGAEPPGVGAAPTTLG